MTVHRSAHGAPPRRRKVSIEIYFVLYLSAIILLLGTTPSQHSGREEELERMIRTMLASDFRVKAEKDAMIFPIVAVGARVDTAGTAMRRDSMNVITAYGTFASVRFQFVAIEDSASGRPIPLERASLVRRSDRSVIFQWKPDPADRGGVYRVTVAGFARPLPSANMSPEMRAKLEEILERNGTVSDSVTFTVNVLPMDNIAAVERVVLASQNANRADSALGAATQPNPVTSPMAIGGAYELTPSQTDIPVPAGAPWRNQISIRGGASADQLVFSVTKGNAQIVERTSSLIVLGGNAPSGPAQQITLSATRPNDGRAATVSFTVRGVPLTAANVPTTMLIGQTYRLNFSVPEIPSTRIAVEVIETDRGGDHVRIGRGESRVVFDYTPNADVQRVRFVRYLDGVAVDNSAADVKALPLPTLGRIPGIPRDADEVKITTESYGIINGQPNRCVLKIKSGNAEEPEEVNNEFDERSKRVRQVWVVRRRSRSEEFRFRMYAIDLRGSGAGKTSEVSVVAAQ